jgi:exodeoxyribonuclease X
MLRVIDIETTGTDAAKDKVIEIASADVSRAGISNTRKTFVDPGIPIQPETSAIHHILDEDVKGAPDFEAALAPFVMTPADWFIAHNASFERGFLEDYLGSNWICTYRCALRIWPDFPAHSNQALRYLLGLASPFGMPRKDISPHRALDDCIVTAAIFLEISKLAKWGDMVRWSSEPPLQTLCRLKKHYGQRWDQIPIDYLQWVRVNIVDDAELQFTAAYWMDQRKLAGAA